MATPSPVLDGDARNRLAKIDGGSEEESQAQDCTVHPRVLTIVANRTVGADRKGEDPQAISEGEDRPEKSLSSMSQAEPLRPTRKT